MTHPLKGRKQSKEHAEKRMNAVRQAMKRPEVREKMRLQQLGEKNSMHGKHHTAEARKKIGKGSTDRKAWEKWGKVSRFKKGFDFRRINNRKGFISKPQKFLFDAISKTFEPCIVVMEHPVKTKDNMRFIDVALPTFKLGFEYDGKYWHQDTEKDIQRNIELKECGWEIIHIKGD